MTRIQWIGGAGVLLVSLAACGADWRPIAPGRTDLAAGTVVLKGRAGPPDGPEGACWASDVTPAVIETETEQVLVRPERRDAAGNIVSPAAFHTETRQKMVRERIEVWFRTPCPDLVDVDFVATLQRALKARGYYLLPVSGVMDAATTDALRRFQAERGLNSGVVSLGAMQELGIVATGLDQLEKADRRGVVPRRS